MRQLEATTIFVLISMLAFSVEGSLISFPIIFFIGSFYMFFFKKVHIYILVFISGYIVDALRVINLGYTPFFLLASIGMIYLYERYSGSKDLLIATLIIFTSGFIYSNVMGYSVFLTVTAYFLTGIGYFVVMYLRKAK